MSTHVLNLPAGASALWQNRLGLLLESTGEGVFGIDLAGNCVFINRAGAQMLGFAAEEGLAFDLVRLGAWAQSRDMLGSGLIDAARRA